MRAFVRFVVVVVAVAGTLLGFVPNALAWTPLISASLGCNGTVSYTVTADELDASRDNSDIAVFDTSGIPQPVASGAFDSSNDWSFSGTYTIPTSVTSDTVTAEALGLWEGTLEEQSSSSVTVTRPGDCTTIATSLSATSIVAGGSANDSATLSGATSTAGGTVTYRLFSDPGCTTPSTAPALDQTVEVSDGSVPDSIAVSFPNAGSYYWQASYSGDANNAAATSPCTSELLTVHPPAPSSGSQSSPTPAASTPTPANAGIAITKNPASQTIASGTTATFAITVTNTGNVALANVEVSDPQSPSCDASSGTLSAFASMAPGASATYTCSLADVVTGFTNIATATGTPPSGPNVSATASAIVTVTSAPGGRAAISVMKQPGSQTVDLGGSAIFKITVTNTGQVPLTHVAVTDSRTPACNRTVGSLAAGSSTSYSCTQPDVTAGFENVATATGTPPSGTPIQASSRAHVSVSAPLTPPTPPQRASITITKSPKQQTLTTKTALSAGRPTRIYATARFRIKVVNVGDVTLRDVRITDPLSPACSRTSATLAALAALGPGESISYSCSRPRVARSFTNVATVTGKPPAGPNVRSRSSARITVRSAPFTPPHVPAKPRPKVVTHVKPSFTG